MQQCVQIYIFLITPLLGWPALEGTPLRIPNEQSPQGTAQLHRPRWCRCFLNPLWDAGGSGPWQFFSQSSPSLAWLKHIHYVKVVIPFSEAWLLYLLFWTRIWAQSSFLFSFISALIFVEGGVVLFLTVLGVRLGGLHLAHGLKAFDDFSCIVVFYGTFYHVLSFLRGLLKNWPQIAILLFQKSITSMFHVLGLRDACNT